MVTKNEEARWKRAEQAARAYALLVHDQKPLAEVAAVLGLTPEETIIVAREKLAIVKESVPAYEHEVLDEHFARAVDPSLPFKRLSRAIAKAKAARPVVPDEDAETQDQRRLRMIRMYRARVKADEEQKKQRMVSA